MGEPSPAAGDTPTVADTDELHAFEDTDRARLSDDELTWVGVCQVCGGAENDTIHIAPSPTPAGRDSDGPDLDAIQARHTCHRSGYPDGMLGGCAGLDGACVVRPLIDALRAARAEILEPPQQPAGPDVEFHPSLAAQGEEKPAGNSAVDTAAIRARWTRESGLKGITTVHSLCDALDARDAEIRELRAELQRSESLSETRRILLNANTDQFLDARTKLKEIRALFEWYTDYNGDIAGEDGWRLARDVRAILDR